MSDYWRDVTSEESQLHVDTVVGLGLSEGERLAKKHGEFFPFGVRWRLRDDEPELFMIDDASLGDQPDSTLLIERIERTIADEADELYAAAVVSDVFIGGEPAIAVGVEHRDGVAFTIFRHYRPRKLGRGAKLGELGGASAELRFWA